MTALHSEPIMRFDATSLVLALSAPPATLSAITGGKASRLAALIADGHPVPSGFVITTHALDTVIATLQRVRRDGALAAFGRTRRARRIVRDARQSRPRDGDNARDPPTR